MKRLFQSIHSHRNVNTAKPQINPLKQTLPTTFQRPIFSHQNDVDILQSFKKTLQALSQEIHTCSSPLTRLLSEHQKIHYLIGHLSSSHEAIKAEANAHALVALHQLGNDGQLFLNLVLAAAKLAPSNQNILHLALTKIQEQRAKFMYIGTPDWIFQNPSLETMFNQAFQNSRPAQEALEKLAQQQGQLKLLKAFLETLRQPNQRSLAKPLEDFLETKKRLKPLTELQQLHPYVYQQLLTALRKEPKADTHYLQSLGHSLEG